MGGAVLVGLLLLLALAIGPREGVRMPDEEGSERPVADVAPQPAEPDIAASDETRLEPGPRTVAQWVPPGSVPHAPQPARAFVAPPETSEQAAPLPSPSEASETPVAGAAGALQWAVQLGSFSSRANADALSEWCREQGYGVQVVTGQDGDQTLHKVRVGPYAARGDADSAVAELALLGRDGFVSDWENASP